jgi:hypothetical protein
MLTRENQKIDTIYRIDAVEGASGHVKELEAYQYMVVCHDFIGRFYYDTLEEARAQHGDLPVIQTTLAWES